MVKFWVFFALVVAVVATVGHCESPVTGSPFSITFKASSDSGERGSGNARSETRTVGAFERIHAEGIGTLDVEVRDGLAGGVQISTDDNLLPLVTTEVKDGTLEIGSRASISPNSGLKLKISTPTLTAVHLEGANKLNLTIDSARPLELRMEGAARVNASGKVPRFAVHSEGAGKVDASNLVAGIVEVRIEGAGHARVNATDTLRAHIEGAGVITYSGEPKTVEKDIAGIGKIARASS
jgi:hypothetical protein